MSAKQERIGQIVSALSSAGTWVSSSTLSKRVGITERTVRNYVSELNARGQCKIESSQLGYRLLVASATETAHPSRPSMRPEGRANLVLSRLVNATGPVSAFDLADDLGISESTLLNTVVPKLRRLAKRYDISLEQKGFELSLSGPEAGLRRMLGYVALHNGGGDYFNSVDALATMFPDFDVRAMLDELVAICQESELFLNNYALNNLMMHLLVILIRLQSGYSLAPATDMVHARDITESLAHRDSIIRCTDRIMEFARSEFGVEASTSDYRQIVALITLSTEAYSASELSRENLVKLVGQPFFDAILQIIELTRGRYGLPTFDDDFLLQLALHVHNAWQRSIYGVPCPNPIASLIKQDYAAIYDIAVFFSHQFAVKTGQRLNEDEIGFIAFHLGAYLEDHRRGENKVSCIVVYERYHDFVIGFLRSLETELGNELEVTGVMDYQTYAEKNNNRDADIVIATIGVPALRPHTILVSPLLSKRSVAKIRQEIEEVTRENRASTARAYARKFFSKELSWRNEAAHNREDVIRLMGARCVELGYAKPEFLEDVIVRENVSGTAFTDIVAIPHAIAQFAERSFIAVLHNDTPISWGERKVNFVLMLGLSREDVRYFQDVLDVIIELFLSPEQSARILATNTFEEFVDVVCGQ